MIISPQEDELQHAFRFRIDTTNNKAEYEALLVGLQIAKKLKVTNLFAFSYSHIIVYLVHESHRIKGEKRKLYLQKVQDIMKSFKYFSITKVPRDVNEQANRLSKLSLEKPSQLGQMITIEELIAPSIGQTNNLMGEVEEARVNWMTLIYNYLATSILPDKKLMGRKIRLKAPQ